MYDDMATTSLSISPKSNLRSGPAALHCDCSAPPRSNRATEEVAARESSKIPEVGIQIQSMEKYALEKIPSPIRIRPEGKAHESSSSDPSPPPSPKRKREVGMKSDMKDVAFTGVLPPRHEDLHRRSQSIA